MKLPTLILLLPAVCTAQQISGVSNDVFLNLRNQQGQVSEISEDIYVRLQKSPGFPLEKYTPEVSAISGDFYLNFTRRISKSPIIYSESVDFPVALKKPAASVAETGKQKVESEVLVADTKSNEKKEPVPTENVDAIAPGKTESKKTVHEPPPLVQEKNVATRQPTDEKKTENVSANEPARTSAIVSNTNPQPKPEPLVKNDPKLPNYHALIIGVSNYKYSGTGIGNLERPVIDATTLSTTLTTHYHFSKTDIHLLKDPTRAEIIDELETLASALTEKDNLIIFYAGHGFWDDNLEIGYWLPSDAHPTKKSSWIGNSTIKDYISGMKTKHTLLVSDACFSGSIFKVREVDMLNEYAVSQLYKLPSRKAMTSGNMKTVPDKSKFFEYFNKRLIENEDPYLSARQLFQNFYVAVINNTSTVPQYGVIQEAGDEGGEFIFIRKQ